MPNTGSNTKKQNKHCLGTGIMYCRDVQWESKMEIFEVLHPPVQQIESDRIGSNLMLKAQVVGREILNNVI